AAAAYACALADASLYALSAGDIPTSVAERDALVRLWEREALLSGAGLLIECDDTDSPEVTRAAVALVERLHGGVMLSSRDPMRFRRRCVRLDVDRPTADEQHTLWQWTLGDAAVSL